MPTKGIVNYPDHIQPLWSRDRGANTCTSCHNSAAKLGPQRHLGRHGALGVLREAGCRATQIDPATGLPVVRAVDGEARAGAPAGPCQHRRERRRCPGLARKSRLMEIPPARP